MSEGGFQPFESRSARVGVITQWDEAKAYGWLKCGGDRIFVHRKDFERGQRRPKAGEEVRFIPGIDPKGRSCAKSVRFVKSGGRLERRDWVWLAGWLVLPGVAAMFLPIPWWIMPAEMSLVSAICYGMYADDKKRAEAGQWRVPESSLHLAELLGGWPGAFLAQRRLRHKCSKASYQVTYWAIVLLFQFASVDVVLGHRLSRRILDYVAATIGMSAW